MIGLPVEIITRIGLPVETTRIGLPVENTRIGLPVENTIIGLPVEIITWIYLLIHHLHDLSSCTYTTLNSLY